MSLIYIMLITGSVYLGTGFFIKINVVGGCGFCEIIILEYCVVLYFFCFLLVERER